MIFQDFDLKTKKLLLLFLSLLLCWWLFFAPGTASAAEIQNEQTRVVYLSELERLDNILNQLQQRNGKLKNELTDSKTALLKFQQELTAALQELKKLQLQLAELKALSVSQKTSVQMANESLEKFAAEEKQKRLKIKAQRNFWECFAAAAVIVAVIK